VVTVVLLPVACGIIIGRGEEEMLALDGPIIALLIFTVVNLSTQTLHNYPIREICIL
jgi:hypothetical protein